MNHVLTAEQFEPVELAELFRTADYMREASRTLTGRQELLHMHNELVVASMFYEPSTRTRLSFESAAQRLGFILLSTENARDFSSAAKGETIEDSTRVISGMADMIVMRHGENDASERAASVSKVPIINGGSGTAEHPTQALLDTYTIYDEKGRLDNLHVAIGGDLLHGRTVKSLARILAHYPDNHLSLVSTPELKISGDVKQYLDQRGTTYAETDDKYEVLPQADVVYWTRTQKERHKANLVKKALRAAGITWDSKLDPRFVIGQQELDVMKPDAIVMHPLPRVGEVKEEIDADPRAAYFRQAENGLYVRMAIVHHIAKKAIKPQMLASAA